MKGNTFYVYIVRKLTVTTTQSMLKNIFKTHGLIVASEYY